MQTYKENSVKEETNNEAKRVGPDFICIGMQKAGTGFLYDNLSVMEGFRLPLVKELHHFDKWGTPHSRGKLWLKKIAAQLGCRSKKENHLTWSTFFIQPS